MRQDLRHAVRLLVQQKGWTLVVILSVALGIGANTALFGAVNTLLFQRLAVEHPESLVRLKYAGQNDVGNDFSEYGFSGSDGAGRRLGSSLSYPVFQRLQADSTATMSGVAAGAPVGLINLVVDGHADLVRAYVATGNFYQVLGVPARLGRTLLPADDEAAAPPAAVLSDGFWNRRFGGDRQIVGKVVRANDTAVTIVGVTGPAFAGIQQAAGPAPDITLPLRLERVLDDRKLLDMPAAWWLQVVGRLRPGVTPAQVQGNLDGVFQATARADWSAALASLSDSDRRSARYVNRTAVPQLRVDSAAHGIYDASATDRQSVTVLTVVVALLLVIVCANVANLLLSRAAARRREISVRLSLGASRGRLIRQLLTESVVLAAAGGAAGLVVGYWSRGLLPIAAGAPTFDVRLVAFAVTLTLATGIAFGLAPAFSATQIEVGAALKEHSRSSSGPRTRVAKALVVAQVALAVALLVGAGLFLRTLRNLQRVDVGFDTANLLMFRVNPQLNHYDTPRSLALYDGMLDRIGALPGVKAVAFSQPPMLSGSVSSTGIFIDGHMYATVDTPLQSARPRGNTVDQVRVAPSFFRTLGIPLRTGRLLTDRDDERAPRVAVINEAAVRAFFAPTEHPIGMRFGSDTEKRAEVEIVGIVADVKYDSLREAAPPTVYFPLRQRCCLPVTFEVRTAADPTALVGAIRDAVRQFAPDVPLANVTTQAEQVDEQMAQERLFAQAYVLFGTIALALASVGLFGLMSYTVGRRTNEIGVRMALGARRADVVALVMKESMTMVAAGLGIGLAVALAGSRLVATLVFGLSATDPAIFLLAAGTMAAVAALAGYLPARRAAHVDPMVALRYE